MPLIQSLRVKVAGPISPAVTTVILRLLTLVALVLMPAGMGAAMAAPADHAPAAASAEHCADHGSQPSGKSTRHSVECVACSMMITTQERLKEPVPVVRRPAARPLATGGTGLHPETATPPPKTS